jgi:hypothetical protein
MKRKYYLSDPSGNTKIFSSFNQMLRYLKLTEEEEMKLAGSLGRVAFAGKEEILYIDEKTGISINYR